LLTKGEIITRLSEDGAGGRNQVKAVLDGLAELAESELLKGENFTIPGIAKINWRYTAPLKKGERYKKGETYTGFGGVEQTAEQDSPARKQSIKLKAALSGPAYRIGKDASAGRRAIAKAKKK
jgi:nucleoid DNA-binding protein